MCERLKEQTVGGNWEERRRQPVKKSAYASAWISAWMRDADKPLKAKESKQREKDWCFQTGPDVVSGTVWQASMCGWWVRALLSEYQHRLARSSLISSASLHWYSSLRLCLFQRVLNTSLPSFHLLSCRDYLNLFPLSAVWKGFFQARLEHNSHLFLIVYEQWVAKHDVRIFFLLFNNNIYYIICSCGYCPQHSLLPVW